MKRILNPLTINKSWREVWESFELTLPGMLANKRFVFTQIEA